MQLNIPPTTKQVTKLTVKAKATLEEYGPAGKKRTADATNGHSENIRPKKAKKGAPHDSTPTDHALALAKTSRPPIPSPRLTVVDESDAEDIMENGDSSEVAVAEREDESPDDILSRFY